MVTTPPNTRPAGIRAVPSRLRLALCAVIVASTALVAATARPLPARAHAPIEVTFQGVTFRIPREYVVALFRGDKGGVDMNLVAETFEPYTMNVDPDFPRNFLRIGLRIFLQSHGAEQSVDDRIRFWLDHWDSLVTQPAEDLDTEAAATYNVPRDLRFRRSLPVDRPGRGSQQDRFLPATPRHDAAGNAIPEAIFCMSPFHPLVRFDTSRLSRLSCEYRFPFRNLETTIYFERHLLPQWKELRNRTIALLEKFAAP